MKGSLSFKAISWLTLLTCVLGAIVFISSHAAFAQMGQAHNTQVSRTSATNSNWAMFDFHHTRFNTAESTLNRTNVSQLQLAWSVMPSQAIGGGTEMVVANGILYTTSPNVSSNNSLDAFNTRTGQMVWQHILSSPAGEYYLAVANGLVYVSDVSYVEAYDAATGKLVWSNAIEPTYAMVVENGVVYVESALGFPSGQSSVYALNAKTGKTLWNTVVPPDLHSSSPAVANGIVYVGSVDGTVYALSASSGQILWTASLGTNAAVVTAPMVDKGIVFVEGDNTGLFALNAQTGKQLWFAPASPYGGSPAVANGMVYLPEGYMQAYNEQTGKLVWQTKGVDQEWSALVANGVVYASSGIGPIAFDAKTGKVLYSYNPGTSQGQDASSTIVADGMVFFSLSYGYTYALKLK